MKTRKMAFLTLSAIFSYSAFSHAGNGGVGSALQDNDKFTMESAYKSPEYKYALQQFGPVAKIKGCEPKVTPADYANPVYVDTSRTASCKEAIDSFGLNAVDISEVSFGVYDGDGVVAFIETSNGPVYKYEFAPPQWPQVHAPKPDIQ